MGQKSPVIENERNHIALVADCVNGVMLCFITHNEEELKHK